MAEFKSCAICLTTCNHPEVQGEGEGVRWSPSQTDENVSTLKNPVSAQKQSSRRDTGMKYRGARLDPVQCRRDCANCHSKKQDQQSWVSPTAIDPQQHLSHFFFPPSPALRASRIGAHVRAVGAHRTCPNAHLRLWPLVKGQQTVKRKLTEGHANEESQPSKLQYLLAGNVLVRPHDDGGVRQRFGRSRCSAGVLDRHTLTSDRRGQNNLAPICNEVGRTVRPQNLLVLHRPMAHRWELALWAITGHWSTESIPGTPGYPDGRTDGRHFSCMLIGDRKPKITLGFLPGYQWDLHPPSHKRWRTNRKCASRPWFAGQDTIAPKIRKQGIL